MSFDCTCVVRLRGLPWSVEIEDIENFMNGCNVRDINLSYTREGKMTGEAYVVLLSGEDFKQALQRNREYIGDRYIDVLPSSHKEMNYNLGGFEPQKDYIAQSIMAYHTQRDMAFHMNIGMRRDHNIRDDVRHMNKGGGDGDAVVRVRGLPFSCDKDMLLGFFDGFPTTPNGVFLMDDSIGRASGEAFIQFSSQAFADVAMQKNGLKIGHRYIEISKSSLLEARSVIDACQRMNASSHRPMPHYRPHHHFHHAHASRGYSRNHYDDGEEEEGCKLYMRGLPYTSNEDDVVEFFYPITPLMVNIDLKPNGKSTGNACVHFENEDDVEEAMKRNKDTIKHRYIELFRTKPRGRH